MDAREVIRHFLRGTDLSCDDLITALEWHDNRIIHRDENHGPTLERAAVRARDIGAAQAKGWKDNPCKDGCGGETAASNTAYLIEEVIRAMGEKK